MCNQQNYLKDAYLTQHANARPPLLKAITFTEAEYITSPSLLALNIWPKVLIGADLKTRKLYTV